jgi:poly(hydroxyalkanoate) granule-associated protein
MTTKKTESKVQDELRESAHRIWLAGLGALAAAEEEGTKLFNRLVERGETVESKGKERVEKAKSKVSSAWDDVEQKLDEKVAKALHKMGVPTRDEIHRLTRRVEELSAKVDQLHARKTGPREVA